MAAILNIKEFEKKIIRDVRTMDTTDEYFTWRASDNNSILMNNDEMKSLMKNWKKLKVDCLRCNFRDYKLNGKMYYGFVIQPQDLENTPMSAIGISISDTNGNTMMVSGYSYLAKSEANREAIWKYLGSKQ